MRRIRPLLRLDMDDDINDVESGGKDRVLDPVTELVRRDQRKRTIDHHVQIRMEGAAVTASAALMNLLDTGDSFGDLLHRNGLVIDSSVRKLLQRGMNDLPDDV